ncbi:MAG: TorD/DmsD family molecular chaperone [Candidatus Binatia bacterium]
MIGNPELTAFRQDYYRLLVSLFWTEPQSDLLMSLSEGIRERIDASGNLHSLLAEGWEEIDRFLLETPSKDLAEAVADEYTRLFLGPHGPEVNPYESYYFTGRVLDRPLAEIRSFLKKIGIEKQDGYPEPEDSLAFELEVMRWLIGKQAAAADPQEEARFLGLQSDFLREHLLVWGPACGQDIARTERGKFYRAVAKILQGFLEIERDFCRQSGLDKITPLDEARQRYGAIPTFRGPIFDADEGKFEDLHTKKEK